MKRWQHAGSNLKGGSAASAGAGVAAVRRRRGVRVVEGGGAGQYSIRYIFTWFLMTFHQFQVI